MIHVLIGCKSDKQDRVVVLSESPLIESHELKAQLGKPGLKVIDVRHADAFQQGHVPGALQVSREDMEYTSDTLPGMRATAIQMAQLLSRKGIEAGNWLVLYDDRGNTEAARLWCILKGYGMNRIKLLNGGLKAWQEDGYEIVTAAQEPPPTVFQWDNKAESLWINGEEIIKKLSDEGSHIVLIDARTPEEFYGVRQKRNAARAGHIPGALHLDWADLIEYHGNHRIKQKEQIQTKLAKFGLSEKDSIILYCHSGVRSSLSTFVLREVMEYPYVWNYDGSWTEWSRITKYPIESDSVTTIFN